MKTLNELQLESVNGGGEHWVHRKGDTNSSGYCVSSKEEANRHVANNNLNDPGPNGENQWTASTGCSVNKQNHEAKTKQEAQQSS